MGNYFLDTQHIKTSNYDINGERERKIELFLMIRSRIKTVIEQEIEKNMEQLDLA